MIRPQCLFITFFLIIGYACAGQAGEDAVAAWQSYSNEENHFTFSYPRGWEVIDEGFYKTTYGLTIQRIGGSEDSNNWIRINSPQFQEEDGKCIEVDMQRICTYSKEADVLGIMERLATSFMRKPGEEGVNKD